MVIMDSMFGDTNDIKDNLRDAEKGIAKYHGREAKILSYTKINKLITALYMVTDIMDKDEPLRFKLRTLGADIISDTYFLSYRTDNIHKRIEDKISEILSFLDVSEGVGMISEMNSNILKREFLELRNSVLEANTDMTKTNPSWLEEFIKEGDKKNDLPTTPISHNTTRGTLVGGRNSTRIGVQKAGTLMKVLSDKIPDIAKKGNVHYENHDRHSNPELKNKRRSAIISAIKDKMNISINFDGLTITDIKSIGHETLSECGEKTLQRELVSMVSDGVLKKTGEKRWSKYSLK